MKKYHIDEASVSLVIVTKGGPFSISVLQQKELELS
jgi:hypothetical protein